MGPEERHCPSRDVTFLRNLSQDKRRSAYTRPTEAGTTQGKPAQKPIKKFIAERLFSNPPVFFFAAQVDATSMDSCLFGWKSMRCCKTE
jgi:hypothetical protein